MQSTTLDNTNATAEINPSGHPEPSTNTTAEIDPSGHPEPSTNTTAPDSTCEETIVDGSPEPPQGPLTNLIVLLEKKPEEKQDDHDIGVIAPSIPAASDVEKSIAKDKAGPSSDQIHEEPPVKEQIEPQTGTHIEPPNTVKGQNTNQLVMEAQKDSGNHPSIPIGPAIDLHKSGMVDGKRVFNNKTPQTTDIYRISFYHVQGNESAPITPFLPESKLQSIDFPGSIFHKGSFILPSSGPFNKKGDLQSGLSLIDNRYLLTMLKACLPKERGSLRRIAKASGQPTNNFRLVMRRFHVTLHIDFGAIMIFEDGNIQGKFSKCGHYYARLVAWCSEEDFIIELNKGLKIRSDEDRVEIPLESIPEKPSDESLRELVRWVREDEA